jgi:hypothetical protein
MKKARTNNMGLKALTTLEGRIKYLESLRDFLDKDILDKNDDSVDASMIGLEIVIGNTVQDLHLLEFYQHKFGKINIKEFVDFMNKENKND